MSDKNIQIRHKENGQWGNLFPYTLVENIFDEEGKQEILEARGEEKNLKMRLDKEYNEVSTQLDATENDLEIKSKLINNNLTSELVRLGDIETFRDSIARRYSRIAFVGDSITAGGNPVETSDRWVEQWQTIFKKSFPGVVFEFQNFGIGGRTLEQFSDINYKSPDNFTAGWANKSGAAWRDYVVDFRPDLIVLAFGMNPNHDKSSSYSMEIIKKFFAGSQKTSFLVLSSLVPNKNWAADWEKRVEYSRSVNNYCRNNNFSFMDVYNKYRILVDGIDESQQIAKLYRNGNGTTSTNGITQTEFNTLNFLFSQRIELKTTNTYKVRFRDNTDILITPSLLKVGYEEVALPNLTGNRNVVIAGTSHVVVTIDGVVYYNKPYYGGFKERPLIFNWETGSGTTSNLKIVNFDFLNVVGQYEQNDIFGEYIEGNIDTKEITGGNGVNHPSSLGYNLIYVPLLYNFIDLVKDDLSSKGITIPKTITFDFSAPGEMDYYNIPNEEKIPFLVGSLERSNGEAMNYRKDIVYRGPTDLSALSINDFVLRRSAGFMQIVTKPQTTKTGYKFTTNVLS